MKRLAGIFLLAVIALALFPACGTVEESSVGAGVDLTREVDRLQGLYREAVRVPITPQIVNLIRKEEKDYLLGEIRYFTSINIALMHSRAGESSMGLENKELPRVRRGGPVQDPPADSGARSSGPDAAPQVSIEFQEIPVLTFKEGGSSLDQRRITSDDEGHLKNLSPGGDIFEIAYPDRGIVLGFTLNREDNWYDLEFAVDETTGERTSLAMTGARPHLMINFQAVFPFGETRIQMDKTLRPPDLPAAAGTESPPPEPPRSGSFDSNPPQVSLVPPEPPPDAPPAGTLAENPPSYPEGETAGREDLEEFYLEEAPPTPWEDRYGEYLGEGESPEVDVVFLAEKPGPSAPDTAAPVPEKTAPAESAFPGLDRSIIQVGALRERQNASAAFAVLEGAGFCPRYEACQDLTRVLIPAVERGDLPRIREELKALGLGEPYVRQ
jgi:hypothetical protein